MSVYGTMIDGTQSSEQSLTKNLIFATIVACLGSIQFGYHISELNAPEQYLVCKELHVSGSNVYNDTLLGGSLGLPQCIDMTEQQFGAVTSMFSVGGLIGSFLIGSYANQHGRKRTSLYISLFGFVGSFIMFYSKNFLTMLLGRFILGLSCGSSIVITPLYINEISPVAWRGALGSMNQLSINLGILLTQSIALKFGNEFQWRWILGIGCLLAIVNFIGWWEVYESPKWLVLHEHDTRNAEISLFHLRQNKYDQIKSEIQKWTNENNNDIENNSVKEPTFWNYITNRNYSKSRFAITMLLVGQQFSGINSIIFYGVKVTSKLLPQHAMLINFTISFINVIMTFVASLIIDKFGRRPLLLISTSLMSIMCFIISISIVNSHSKMFVTSIFIYIASFAIGIGPIPFLIIGELSPNEASAIAQSYGTVCNWIGTFIVGYTFPLLNIFMDGYVYMIFSISTIGLMQYIYRYLPETKGKSNSNEVWN